MCCSRRWSGMIWVQYDEILTTAVVLWGFKTCRNIFWEIRSQIFCSWWGHYWMVFLCNQRDVLFCRFFHSLFPLIPFLIFVLSFIFSPTGTKTLCLQWMHWSSNKNGDHTVRHLTRMDLSDVLTSVMATIPANLPPNSSFENVNHTSSSSPRSPPLPPHSQVASVFIVLVVSVIILGTVVGNVLVVVAVFTSRALRPPQNLFLVSLASADILVATLVIPFSLANEVRKHTFQSLSGHVIWTRVSRGVNAGRTSAKLWRLEEQISARSVRLHCSLSRKQTFR